jgi:hypothetical protein
VAAVNWQPIFRALHHLGSAGVLGAFASILVVVLYAPSPENSLVGYAAARTSIAMISKWILVPALLLVICSGLLSMAVTPAYQNAGWAWFKAVLGLAMFEGTLVIVDAAARKTAEFAAAAAQAGQYDPAALATLVAREQNGLWALLAVAVANVAIGVWRPRFARQIKD